MTARFHTLAAEGISVTLDQSIGHLRDLRVDRDGAGAAPLHLAPWAGDADVPVEADTPPNVKALGGDFLCAPFGGNDVEPAPSHGWTANAPWTLIDEEKRPGGPVIARFELSRPVFGARVVKELTLRDGHPFLYQRHVFSGGEGAITAAHHVNTRMPSGGRLNFSPKAYVDIPGVALETDPARGRSLLAYPSRTGDLSALPLAAGGTVDLHRYPIGDRHEDFVMLVEDAASTLGWTAVLRDGERDILLVLKNPAVLPVTLLWFSNGGRDYAPWNGRHTAVLGIEDGRCWSLYGHAASLSDNPLKASGVPTAFDLSPNGTVIVRHVIGALPAPPGWTGVASVTASRDRLTIADASGETLGLAYDAGFLLAGEA